MATLFRLSRVAALAAPLLAVAVGCRAAVRTSRGSAASNGVDVPPRAAALALAAAPDQFFTVGDVRLRYREIGRGEPVILLHALTRDLDSWVGIADSLALDHRVIALDLRGSGQSSRFRQPSRLGTAMADDVVRLLDHLHADHVHLVGHSMGAVVAAYLAARYPARFVTASLIAPPLYADSATYARAHADWVADLEGGAGMVRNIKWLFPGMPDSDAVAGSVSILATNPPTMLAAVMASVSALMVPASRASTIRVPTLVATGTKDPLLPQARWVASWWPGARLLEVPGASHGDIVDRPEVWSAVRMLMRAHAASSRRSSSR